MINKTELTSKYVKEYNGKLSQKKLAELLHHKHPDLYHNVEYARTIIRKIIGKAGKELGGHVFIYIVGYRIIIYAYYKGLFGSRYCA